MEEHGVNSLFELGTEGCFLDLVDPSRASKEWIERLRGHRISSMLDIGMHVPLAGLYMLAEHGLADFEGYDLVDEARAVAKVKHHQGMTNARSVMELAREMGGERSSSFLEKVSRAHFGYNQDVTDTSVLFRRKSYDLVVLSNVLHGMTHLKRAVLWSKLFDVVNGHTKLYVHIKSDAQQEVAPGPTLDALIEECAILARKFNLWSSPPYIPNGGSTKEGVHYTWTNL